MASRQGVVSGVKRKAFSLIELTIVIAIMGVLMYIVGQRLLGEASKKQMQQSIQNDLDVIYRSALEFKELDPLYAEENSFKYFNAVSAAPYITEGMWLYSGTETDNSDGTKVEDITTLLNTESSAIEAYKTGYFLGSMGSLKDGCKYSLSVAADSEQQFKYTANCQKAAEDEAWDQRTVTQFQSLVIKIANTRAGGADEVSITRGTGTGDDVWQAATVTIDNIPLK